MRPLIIVLGFYLFFGAGCTTRTIENPGAKVELAITTDAVLQANARRSGVDETVAGILIKENGVMFIDVSDMAPHRDVLHEFCHLVDQYGGDMNAALAVLTPPSGTFADRKYIKAFMSRVKPLGSLPHWRELQKEYGSVTVQHVYILNLLQKEGPNPPPLPPPPGLATMSLDD